MNHYKKNLARYIKDTAGLTMIEDGAYNRMLDLYYASERPLSLEVKEIYKDTRCAAAVDRKAVDYCLKKYFTRTDEGYVQKHAQQHLVELKIAQETARENGARGGRPNGPRDHVPDPDDPGGTEPHGLAERTQRDTGQDTERVPDGLARAAARAPAQGTLSTVGSVVELQTPTSKASSKAESAREQARETRQVSVIARRLGQDWRKDFDYVAEAAELKPQWPKGYVEFVADGFSDFWHSKGGREAAKVDWRLTWRNWLRREKDPAAASRSSTVANSRQRVAQAIFGEQKDERQEPNDITAEAQRLA